MFAYQDGDGWHFETVDESRVPQDDLFLAIGPDGQNHILYQCNDFDISYAYRGETGWHPQQIFSETNFVWDGLTPLMLYVNSLALDSAGRPHGTVTGIYAKGTVVLVYHIYLGDTGWQVELVGPGRDGALAIGPGDALHVARTYQIWDYHPYPIDSFLEHSYRDELGWHSEEVAHPPTGLDVAIAVDSGGQPHIVTNGAVAPGNYYRKDSGGWNREIAVVASEPILMLDEQDVPSISSTSYFDTVFSTWRPGGWQSVHLGVDDTASYTVPGMALDAAGNAHLVYRQKSTYNVIYLRPYTGPVYSVYLTSLYR